MRHVVLAQVHAALRKVGVADEVRQRRIELYRARRKIVEARAGRLRQCAIPGCHARCGLEAAREGVEQHLAPVAHLRALDGVVDVRDDGDALLGHHERLTPEAVQQFAGPVTP